MFARYAIPALIASFTLAALISPGCDPCPKCVHKKRVVPTPTLTPFSPTPTPTATLSRTATPSPTATVMPGPVGGAPLGAITVLVTGSYVPPTGAPKGAVIGNVTSGGVTAYIPDGDYGSSSPPNVEVVPVA